MIENKKEVKKKSYTRIIIDSFIEKKAVNYENSILYDEIDLCIPNNEKKFLLNNLIKDDLIRVKPDGSMWFDEKLWNKTVNNISRKYLIILIAPILITIVLSYIFKYFT